MTIYLFLEAQYMKLTFSTLQIIHFYINLSQGRLLTKNNIYAFAYAKNNLKG